MLFHRQYFSGNMDFYQKWKYIYVKFKHYLNYIKKDMTANLYKIKNKRFPIKILFNAIHVATGEL